MKKLYKVYLEYEIVVLAEDEFKAESIARDNVEDEEPSEWYAHHIQDEFGIPNGWEDSYPHGAPPTATVSQIVGEKDAESRKTEG
jgi:hypothetical protein